MRPPPWRRKGARVGAAVEKIEEKRSPKIFSGTARGQRKSEGFPAISSSNLSSATKRNSNANRRCCFFFDFRMTSNYRPEGSRGNACDRRLVDASYISRAAIFTKSPLTHSAASPHRKRSRSACLFACKRAHDGALSLPTFCEKTDWRKLHIARGDFYKITAYSFRCVSSSQKVTLRSPVRL